MPIGLRIDVDTLRGHREGVPRLYRILKKHNIQATFFFSAGPDNMGRHLFRLLKPGFAAKMFKSSAASLYGWDIVLRGTLWPGPVIGKRAPEIIRICNKEGHELGLHAWDHHEWQSKIEKMSGDDVYKRLRQAFDLISEAADAEPVCSAAPSWKITEAALLEKEHFPFRYNSDCRGGGPFLPLVTGRSLKQPQVPDTLPTYDEVIGRDGITDINYNETLLNAVKKQKNPVLTIHAEAEGISKAALFEDFIVKAKAEGLNFVPLGSLLPADFNSLPKVMIERGEIFGREGWVSLSSAAV